MGPEHTFYATHLVDALLEEGIPATQIWELPGWKQNQRNYFWTDVRTGGHWQYEGFASGHLNHHTATTAYTPFVRNSSGQTKANTFGGLRRGDRLYQAGGGVPTIAITSAGPANYSAGAGVRSYVEALRRGERRGRQTQPDDSPTWYGNRYLFSTEWVLDGIGSPMDPDVWDLLVVYNAALARLHDQPEGWNGFHQGLTTRKVDLWAGQHTNAEATTEAIWAEVARLLTEEDLVDSITDATWKAYSEAVGPPFGDYRYYCRNDGTVDFAPPWGAGAIDGQADDDERANAFNVAQQTLAAAAT